MMSSQLESKSLLKMIFLTHLLGGALSVIYLGNFFGVSGKLAVAVAALFAVLPDIDTVKSKVGRRAEPFSTVLSFVFRHRGFLHSFVFAAVVYFGMRYLFSANIAAAATVGYSSHLLLDAVTKEGIVPFSPFSKMRIKGFVRTKGFLELLLFSAMLLLIFFRLS